MSLFYCIESESIVVSGRTFLWKDHLRDLGGRYEPGSKTWRLPNRSECLESLMGLVAKAGGSRLGEDIIATGRPQSAPQTVPVLRLSDLLNRIQQALNASFGAPIWITGEVHNVSARNGHRYFQLTEDKDTDGTYAVNAVFWQKRWHELATKLSQERLEELICEDTQVKLLCQVQFYRERGQVSLQILDIDADFTKGALAMRRAEILRGLESKGILRANASLTLIRLPLKIGLISAPGSRALSDFCDQLVSAKFPGTVRFWATTMQGERTPQEVQAAILGLQDCDVIVLTRGGGSGADLRWFDHELIAEAICRSKVPIIAAIGHHDDTCLAEMVAFHREKTPTAAADYLNARLQLVLQSLKDAHQTLQTKLRQRLEQVVSRCSIAEGRLTAVSFEFLHSAQKQLLSLQNQIDRDLRLKCEDRLHTLRLSSARLEQAATHCVTRMDDRFAKLRALLGEKTREQLHQALAALQAFQIMLAEKNPRPWLDKGWTQLSQLGKPLRTVRGLRKGTLVTARLADGSLDLQIKSIQRNDSEI